MKPLPFVALTLCCAVRLSIAGPESLRGLTQLRAPTTKPVLYDALPRQFQPFPRVVLSQSITYTNFTVIDDEEWRSREKAHSEIKKMIKQWIWSTDTYRPAPLLPEKRRSE